MRRVRAGSQNLSLSRHILSTPHSDCRRQFSKSPDQTLPGQHLHQTHGAKSNHENAARGSRHVLQPPSRMYSNGLLQALAPAMARAGDTRPTVSGCVSVPRWRGEARRSGYSWVCLCLLCWTSLSVYVVLSSDTLILVIISSPVFYE